MKMWMLVVAVALAPTACGSQSDVPLADAPPQGAAPGPDAGDFGAAGSCVNGPDFTNCPCRAGETKACYTGPAATRGVGICKDGAQSCSSSSEIGTVFGACMGQTLPRPDGTGCSDGVPAKECTIAAPRLLAPLSTSRATHQKPNLKWALAAATDGAYLDLCADKACTRVLETLSLKGAAGAPSKNLPPGVVFWRARGMKDGKVGCDASPTWEIFVNARSAPVNTGWGSVLDLNEDGYADMAVGTGEGGFVGPGTGVYVYNGSSAGLRTPATKLPMGDSAADAGDVNGDGFADLIVGDNSAHRASLYLGGPSGVGPAPATTLILAADSRPDQCASGVGDTNGDGYADVVVSGGDAGPGVYLGGPSGLATSPALTLSGTFCGTSAGDVNGDQLGDVIAQGKFGTTYVFHGSPTGLVAPAATSLPMPTSEMFPFGVGDVNGDGYADIAVNIEDEATGSDPLLVFHGGPAGVSTMPATVLRGPNPAGDNEFGSVVVGLDVNGDGFWDLAVANLQWDLTSPSSYPASIVAEQVHLFMGGPGGVATSVAATLDLGAERAVARDQFGASLGGSDVNGDGFADLAIGAPGLNKPDRASVYLFPGSSAGVVTSPSLKVSGPLNLGFSVRLSASGS